MFRSPRNLCRRSGSRHGLVLVYVCVIVTVLMAIVSLGVDLARVQLAKTELQAATDASARFAAAGLKNILRGESAAASNAIAAAKDNFVDGSPLVLDPNNDIKLVIWNYSNHTYKITTDPDKANGVQILAQRTQARGNPIPLVFARLLGMNSCDIHASAIATAVDGDSETYKVDGTNNPFLAGMPEGSVASKNNPHNNPDYAGKKTKSDGDTKQRPTQTDIPITPGLSMTFDGITGGANNEKSATVFTADGNTSRIENNYSGNDNGFGNMYGPLNALVGVFLDDKQPDSTVPPPSLNFTTSEQRDFTLLQPQVKQIFFIGDGRNSDGVVQQFVPPPGATRLYLATWDGYEWNNNIGSLSVTVHLPSSVSLVR